MTESLSYGEKLTPMMEQYRSVKKTLPKDTLLFFRLGDFYEMFFEDAILAADVLNITLTGREAGPAGRVPMCGIPYHAFQAYVRILLDHNLKVAICEQIGDPKAAKGLVERKITRIISPATYVDDREERKSFEYMVALVRNETACALASLELSTGEFYVREVPPERLQGEISLLRPRDVILAKRLALRTFLEEREEGKLSSGLEREQEEVAALIACKRKSVTAFDPLAGPSMEALLARLARCENPLNCPHGRPTLIRLSFSDLERQFKRK